MEFHIIWKKKRKKSKQERARASERERDRDKGRDRQRGRERHTHRKRGPYLHLNVSTCCGCECHDSSPAHLPLLSLKLYLEHARYIGDVELTVPCLDTLPPLSCMASSPLRLFLIIFFSVRHFLATFSKVDHSSLSSDDFFILSTALAFWFPHSWHFLLFNKYFMYLLNK